MRPIPDIARRRGRPKLTGPGQAEDRPMNYESLIDDGDHAGLSDDFQEANGVAFILASNAFLKLAEAYMRREEAAALGLISEVEAEMSDVLRRYAMEPGHRDVRADVMLEAAHKLGALLNAGRALSKAAPGVH
ncbi:hypothetical protein ACYCO6_07525 [Methylobacterium sp. CM6257]